MCHCHACQKRTGSAFGVQARFPAEKVTFAGQVSTWVRTGDSGGAITYRFCPTCGSTIAWEIDKLPGFVAVAAGAFADSQFPRPTVSIYGARRHAWSKMPDGVEELD